MAVQGTELLAEDVSVIDGLMVQFQSAVKYGESEAALRDERVVNGLPVNFGIRNDEAFQVGETTALSFSHVPSTEDDEAVNVLQSNFQAVTGLEATFTVGIKQLSGRLLAIVAGTAVRREINDGEQVIVGGLSCASSKIPFQVDCINEACEFVAAPGNTNSQVRFMTLSLYSCQSQSGLELELDRSAYLNYEAEFGIKKLYGKPSSAAYWNAYIA